MCQSEVVAKEFGTVTEVTVKGLDLGEPQDQLVLHVGAVTLTAWGQGT